MFKAVSTKEHRGRNTGISTRGCKQAWLEIFENDHKMLVLDQGVTQVTVSTHIHPHPKPVWWLQLSSLRKSNMVKVKCNLASNKRTGCKSGKKWRDL